MTTIETQVIGTYANSGLQAAIAAGWDDLKAMSDAQAVDQLAGVDEFHIGGRVATRLVCAEMALVPGLRVLDVGCGLGGAARFMADSFDVQVEGIDLTPDYIAVGRALTREVGLDDLVQLDEASALDLPQADASVDRVSLFHVGMNIADKPALFAEIARVLKPGGLFGLYDVMRVGDGALDYPVAWAQDETTSFVASVAAYRAGLAAAGLIVELEQNKADLGREFFATMKARMAKTGPPPLGLHLVMGADAGLKVANMAANIAKGVIAPVLILARRQ